MTVEQDCIPITIRGRYFWRGDERFFIRGVTYQPWEIDRDQTTINDCISDDRLAELQENLKLFKELGINTLYIYNIDSSKQHDEAMKLLEDAGMYVVAGVSTNFNAINRRSPYKAYNTANVTAFLKTAGLMAKYPNTLGIVAGNSIVNSTATLNASPVIKAVIRDLKKYLLQKNQSKGTRILPVGYSAANNIDIAQCREFLQHMYYGDKESTVDFWSPRNYSWHGESSMEISGWDLYMTRYEDFPIPVFLSEYGSNTNDFHDTKALFSPPMTKVFSGGCYYDFDDGGNSYGLVATPSTDRPFGNYNKEKTIETRTTSLGNLHIYSDFAYYKAALAEPVLYDKNWDTMEKEEKERYGVDVTQMSWSWGSEYQMPDTCIDWNGAA